MEKITMHNLYGYEENDEQIPDGGSRDPHPGHNDPADCSDVGPPIDGGATMERMREIAEEIRGARLAASQPTPLDLYDLGWGLIPVNADKTPMVRTWGPYQSQRATPEQIAEWSQVLDPPVWAAPTGPVSNRFTLDFDGPEGLATLHKLHLQPHRSTPRGGFHVDFIHPGWPVKTMAGNCLPRLKKAYPGMDVRGDGGYINLLGHTVDGDYEWLSLHEEYTVAVLPFDLTAMIRKDRPDEALVPLPTDRGPIFGHSEEFYMVSDALVEVIAADTPRNATGFQLACQIRDSGYDYEFGKDVMLAYQAGCPETDAQGKYAPYTVKEALASLDQAFSRPARPPARPVLTRPEIATKNRQLRDKVDDAIRVLQDANQPLVRFVYEGRLARLLRQGSGKLQIQAMDQNALIGDLSEVADWVGIPSRTDAYGEWKPGVSVDPPPSVARSILARPQMDEFPPIRGVIGFPTLRDDGSVVDSNGYDDASEFYVDIPADLRMRAVSRDPSDDEVAEALVVLRDDLLGEFEFADEASAANALGYLLTVALRPAIQGSVPLVLIDAPSPGCGKTLLANLAALVSTGDDAAVKPAPDNDRDLRKLVTALLREGETLLIFDNLESLLKSPVLSAALTSKVWSDRILGVSETIRVEQRAVWVVTGNNIRIGGDLPRRCYRIRLDSSTAFAWTRDFKRKDIETWVRENHGDYLWACLTLGRAWFARNCPPPSLRPFGSFEDWQMMIGGILEVAGVKEFLGNLRELQEHGDPDHDRTEALFAYFYERTNGEAVPSSALLSLVEPFERSGDLPSALVGIVDSTTPIGSQSAKLSHFLSAHKDRRMNVQGLRCIEARRDGNKKRQQWLFVTDPTEEHRDRLDGAS